MKDFNFESGNLIAYMRGGELKVEFKSGVESVFTLPLDWGFTRVMQFVESLQHIV